MSFTVIPPAPTVTSFNPGSGSSGDAIMIVGTNLTGATSVKFNGVRAKFTVDNEAQIIATVPTGCSSGLIEITTGGGTVSSSTGFIVTGGDGTIAVKHKGTALTAAAKSINFVGAGVAASLALDEITVNVPGGGVGTPSTPAAIKTANYTAVAGDVIVADTSSSSWELTLPISPALGDAPITVYGGSDFSINSLIVKLGANNYQRKAVASGKLITTKPFANFQLIYAGSTIGWLESPGSSLSVTSISDQSFSNVVLLMHMNGTNGSTVFTDVKGKTVAARGNAQISTAQNKFDGASGYFDGSGGYLQINSSTDFDFTTSNFEGWFYTTQNTIYQVLFDRTARSQNSYQYGLKNNYLYAYFITSTAVEFVGNTQIPLNTWTHLAFVNDNGTGKFFINGILDKSFTIPNGVAGQNLPLTIARSNTSLTYYFQGYIDEVRITKGVTSYTSNFTPPTSAFPNY